MKNYVLIPCLMSLLFMTSCSDQSMDKVEIVGSQLAKPEGHFDYATFENDKNAKRYKREYERDLYHAARGTDIEGLRKRLHRKNKADIEDKKRIPGSFADGSIEAEWFERGPDNEAGDVREVDYNPVNDDLFVVTTARHIWKGNLDGRQWELLSDKERFNNSIFKHVVLENGTDRLLAIFGSGEDQKKLRYSDDNGKSWILSKGYDYYDHWGSPRQIEELSDGKTLFFLAQTWIANPWGAGFEVYRSDDYGTNWSLALRIAGGSYGASDVTMWKYPKSDRIIVYDLKEKNRYLLDHNVGLGQTSIIGPQALTGTTLPQTEILATGEWGGLHFIMTYAKDIYSSNDGLAWSFNNTMSIEGSNVNNFRNGFLANPNNNELYAGGFQFLKSSDGYNWQEQYDYWWTYYDRNLTNQKDYMHVDIMDIQYYEKQDNTPFIIILNHAGVYVSYDNMQTTTNLGLDGLNCVTLYDHATAPDGSIYLGAQDKGTFSTAFSINENNEEFSSVNQTTGDGMRELFFNNGKSWFGMLQNGFMMCKPLKEDVGGYKSWSVPGSDIPGWINPIENHPDPSAMKCYVAGGDINGGSGSYLIEMGVSFDANGDNFSWNPTQFNFDFKANSRNGSSVIKAIGATPADESRLYVATNDGTFFYSNDRGVSWSRSTANISNDLRPWDIAVDQGNADKVYLCGTGWSNSGVYESNDGGQTFEGMTSGIPTATFFDLALSPDGSQLYAATSEGPYVYVFDMATWYYIGDENSPQVDFRSVEYLEVVTGDVVRFGTYGRGILDFKIDNGVRTSLVDNKVFGDDFAYPNPSRSTETIILERPGSWKYSVVNASGQEILHGSFVDHQEVKMNRKGIYTIHLQNEYITVSDKVIVQ